jgi:hypothetical protein
MLSTLANNSARDLPMQCPTTHLHWNPTTTIHTYNTTKITNISTAMITSINTANIDIIDTMINSPAHLVTVISFTSATVATAPTTAARVTAFTTAPTTTIYFIPQTYFSVCRALALEIIRASASPMVLFGQELHMAWQGNGELATYSHLHAMLAHQYATNKTLLNLDSPPKVFNTTKLSHKIASPTSLPLYHKLLKPVITSQQARGSLNTLILVHDKPITFILSVCPYSTVSIRQHSRLFASTYNKTLRHGGRLLTMILATESFLGSSFISTSRSSTSLRNTHNSNKLDHPIFLLPSVTAVMMHIVGNYTCMTCT